MDAHAHGRPTLAILAIWGVLCAFLLALGFTTYFQGRFPGPDDVLRLVQVRDLLAGRSWFDLHQYRIDPPDGTLMHWSRLVDAPLALLIVILRPLFGAAVAEQIALVAVPLLTLGAILLCVGRLALRLFDRETMIFSCLCVGVFSAVMFQLQPGRIDHHGYQILAVAVALWALAWDARIRGSAMAGLAMAFGLTISIELLPMTGAFGIVLAWRWFRDAEERWSLTAYMASLALGLAVLFLATRGIADLAAHCDVIAPAHLAFFTITALGTWIIAKIPRASLPVLIGLFACAGIAGLGLFAGLSPQCVAAPFGSLHPLVHEYWYQHIVEGRPVWEQPWVQGLAVMIQLLIALATAVIIATRYNGARRDYWSEYSLLLALAICGGALTFRSVIFAQVIAATPLGWLALQLLKGFRRSERIVHKLIAAVAIIAILQPLAVFTAAQAIMPKDDPAASSASTSSQAIAVRFSSCDLQANALRLNRIEPATLFSTLDVGPSLLHQTHHAVAATSHHRANEAMRDVILAFTSPEDVARTIINAHGAQYVVVCRDLSEPRLLAEGGGADSLMARIMAGDEPDWLEPMDIGLPESFKLYRVK